MTVHPDAAGHDVEALLAAHVLSDGSYAFHCSCDAWKVAHRDAMYPDADHRAHVAAVLAARIMAAQAEALREAADELDAEDDSTIEPHAWVRDKEAVRIIDWLRDRAAQVAQSGSEDVTP
jgi:hypothetical protein